MQDVIKIKKDTPDEALAIEFLDRFSTDNSIDVDLVPPKYGALQRI